MGIDDRKVFDIAFDDKDNEVCSYLIRNGCVDKKYALSVLLEHNKDIKQHKEILYEIFNDFEKMENFEQNNPYHTRKLLDHVLTAVETLDENSSDVVKLAVLFHDTGKLETKTTDENGIDHFYKHSVASEEIAEKALNELNYDEHIVDKVKILIHHHEMDWQKISDKTVQKFANKLEREGVSFEDYLQVRKADILAQNPEKYNERLLILSKISEIYKTNIKQPELDM